jgi:O-antigen/teichoic acid export membrane protein
VEGVILKSQSEDDFAIAAVEADSYGHNSRTSSGVIKRLTRGLGATALQPVVTAAIQLGSVPILLHAWGPAKYGDWLILSAIPSYLALSDLGFGDASGSDMTVRVAGGDKEGALETFQSSWALLSFVSLISGILAAIGIWVVPWYHWVQLASLSGAQAASVVLVFAAYILASQQTSILESGFRCDGNFATGVAFATLLRLVEVIAGTALGILTGSLFWAASGYLIIRSVGSVVYRFLLLKRSPWLLLGFRHARFSRVRQLAAPALGFMALPLASAISLQGFTVMIASVDGPLAVTAFSTLRTMTRVNFQVMAVLSWAIWPELSRAFGQGNLILARKLHRYGFQAGLALSAIMGTAVWLFGPTLYRWWLHGVVPFDAACFHILVLVTVANSLWFNSSVVPMSTNAHHWITLASVASYTVSLGVGRILLQHFGLSGAAAALLLTDVSMLWIVLYTSLRQLQDQFGAFLRAIVAPPPLFQMAATLRRALL